MPLARLFALDLFAPGPEGDNANQASLPHFLQFLEQLDIPLRREEVLAFDAPPLAQLPGTAKCSANISWCLSLKKWQDFFF